MRRPQGSLSSLYNLTTNSQSLFFELLLFRDIYYKDVQLFKRQEVVDRIVEDLAHTFGVERSTLSIVAAAKGIVCGNAIIFKKDGTTLDCATEGEV